MSWWGRFWGGSLRGPKPVVSLSGGVPAADSRPSFVGQQLVGWEKAYREAATRYKGRMEMEEESMQVKEDRGPLEPPPWDKAADAPLRGYVDPDEVKKDIGVCVDLFSGNPRSTYLFGAGSSWRYVLKAGTWMVEVWENGRVAAHIRAGHVVAVTGPQALFRDAWWRPKE